MQIFTNGYGEKTFAPNQIVTSVIFNFRANTYDEALHGGVKKVKDYVNYIAETTDFKPGDFRTNSYSVREQFHINKLDPKSEADLDKNLQKRVSDGFFFTQSAHLNFDYDKTRLAKLLAITSKIPNAPMLNINFTLKDTEAKKRELIALAYEDAKQKAETLALAASKILKDCIRVEIDNLPHHGVEENMMLDRKMSFRGTMAEDISQQIRNIDETFKPDDIILSKTISCTWEAISPEEN